MVLAGFATGSCLQAENEMSRRELGCGVGYNIRPVMVKAMKDEDVRLQVVLWMVVDGPR